MSNESISSPALVQRIDLSGKWEFRGATYQNWMPAEVPGCVHTDLQRHGLISDPFFGRNELKLEWIEKSDWEYRTTFEITEEQLAPEHVELVLEGLDTLAEVLVNGRTVLKSETMFVGYSVPVKSLLKAGENLLEIRFANAMNYIEKRKAVHYLKEWNDPVGGCSNIRKEQCQFGWDWGPRLVTTGVFLPVYLESRTGNKILSCRIDQKHSENLVNLTVYPETALPVTRGTYALNLSLEGKLIASVDGALSLDVNEPELWWPHGYGRPVLYELEVILRQPKKAPVVWKTTIGLRTIELKREADAWGESFTFVVNGRPIFAKGASWIPAHSFVTAVDDSTYENLLTSACMANMNMLRVWGGGIYEKEIFYKLCDEKGLLVWQDFMFACALYPADDYFLGLVKQEACYQIRRLRNHPSLALWCGNNELEWFTEFKEPKRRAEYDAIFNKLLPEVVALLDGSTAYWPSSPHQPEAFNKQGVEGCDAGDRHDWAVWHGLCPATHFEKMYHRFCSEFGMQSYPAPQVAKTMVSPGQLNIFSADFENHQKHDNGNGKIFHYLSQFYRFPKDYTALSYLSQLNQAHCVKVGVEHWRRNMPRCMGALYWQLNDCWPVASWSSIDFGGKWKALQYEAKRFFAPALVTAEVVGKVSTTKGNYYHNDIKVVKLYTVYDGLEPLRCDLRWTLFHIVGEVLRDERKPVVLNRDESVLHEELDFSKEIAIHGHENLVMRITLERGTAVLAENTVLFTVPRFMELPKTPILTDFHFDSMGHAFLQVSSVGIKFNVQLELRDCFGPYRFSNNYFNLWSDRPSTVKLTTEVPYSRTKLRQMIQVLSLAEASEG
ncbi:MAG: glycoside hydrolase family 2 protein [Verrucomicrobiota bacterium]|nr:glycoside hydrolase family 2 protein [Verrucomicrobiota bacterium]